MSKYILYELPDIETELGNFNASIGKEVIFCVGKLRLVTGFKQKKTLQVPWISEDEERSGCGS